MNKEEMELKEGFWIKKTVRNIVKDAKKDVETERLTVTLSDGSGTNINITGDPDTLGWLQSGLDVSVHIKSKTNQSRLGEDASSGKGEQKAVKAETDEEWDPDTDE